MARCGRKSQVRVVLDEIQRAQLMALLRAQNTPLGRARRAWAVLLIAGGESFAGAARQVGMAERHVRRWVQRYLAQGLEGLGDGPRTGRPPVFSPGGGDASGQDRLRVA